MKSLPRNANSSEPALQDRITEDPSWDDETKQLFRQAKLNNPDKYRFIPDVVRGVAPKSTQAGATGASAVSTDGLKGRLEKQKARTQELTEYLDIIDSQVAQAREAHVVLRDRISECKRVQADLAQNCLQVPLHICMCILVRVICDLLRMHMYM